MIRTISSLEQLDVQYPVLRETGTVPNGGIYFNRRSCARRDVRITDIRFAVIRIWNTVLTRHISHIDGIQASVCISGVRAGEGGIADSE